MEREAAALAVRARGVVAADGAVGDRAFRAADGKYAAAITTARVAADGAIAFYRNGLTPDVQATAGVVAFIPGDRAVLHIEAAVTVHTHTAAAVNLRLNFVIGDLAAVHGKVAQSSLTATPRFIIFHPHATAAFCRIRYSFCI